ncbi:MAG: putative membrane protein [Candidatus Magasanikbacteria bacterium GW2011_GWC2_37_14]|uniref:Putative membrane protein n=1 Tax=Candidatus Magasanikbacteria bacterium GW2011_GWC2_37_14 TaxID=1619046 RepID=A0A0G0GA32_9BACT|nr:MAG: putative membrane protein [Candidatus Magasanikbacteria bacterium GW2011_GWC2_37_14]
MEEQNQTPQSVLPIQMKSGPGDVQENKILAIIGYLGILCLIPLLLKRDSQFAQYHGKQGVMLLIGWVVINVVMVVPILGWIVGFVGNIACLVLMIVGIVNAAQGQMKELPWIGKYAGKINL